MLKSRGLTQLTKMNVPIREVPFSAFVSSLQREWAEKGEVYRRTGLRGRHESPAVAPKISVVGLPELEQGLYITQAAFRQAGYPSPQNAPRLRNNELVAKGSMFAGPGRPVSV